MSEIKKQNIDKLTNKRVELRSANLRNKGERCGFCRFFLKPNNCKIVVGPVGNDFVCNWIQGRGVEKVPRYRVSDEDWIAFGKGMVKEQPYQHKVRDVAFTPEGPMVLVEDTTKPKPHYFSLTKDFHIEHTSLEHHWTQNEVDRLISAGKGVDETVKKQTPSGPIQDPEAGTIRRQIVPVGTVGHTVQRVDRDTIQDVTLCVRNRTRQNIAKGMRKNAALLEALKFCKGTQTVRR